MVVKDSARRTKRVLDNHALFLLFLQKIELSKKVSRRLDKRGEQMRNKYLTERERYVIEFMLSEKHSVKAIAEKLDKCVKTIYNEIKRGMVEMISSELVPYKKYCADFAQRNYIEACKNKGKDLKIGNDLEFVRYVEKMIKDLRYSPVATLADISIKKLVFKTQICFKTLYNYIDKGIFLNISNKDLPVKKTGPRRAYNKVSVALNNRGGRSIEERPKSVEARISTGDWEMDTVVGGKGTSKACLLVLTERASRKELIRKIPDKSMASVVNALNEIEKLYGFEEFRNTFRTITSDNGCEFLNFKGTEMSCLFPNENRTVLYYCHPYNASERGSNENGNKLIRRFVPKGCDIGIYSDEEIQKIETWMNNYPRKILGYETANMAYEKMKG